MRLKCLASVIAGQSPPSEEVDDLEEGMVPFLQGNAEFGPEHPQPRFACDSAAKHAFRGDVLLSVRAPVGALNVADRRYAIGRGLVAIRAKPGTDARYLWWVVQGLADGIRALANGSTYEAVTAEDVESMALPTWPLTCQQRIAGLLDAETTRIDQLMSALQRLSRVMTERNVALARRLIFGELARISTDRHDLPVGWEATRLKRLATIRRGRFGHRPRNDPALYGGQYPFVQTGDIASARRVITSYSQSLNDQGLATSAMFPAGTLAMAIAANIGDVAVLGFDACFPDSVVAFVPRPNVQPVFLYHLLRATRPELLGVATLNTQLNVNTERIGEVVVPLPPREEQDVIVKTIDRAMDLEERGIVAISRQIALLKERRQALITAAVTGELDVTMGAA